MNVRELMTTDVVVAQPSTPLKAIAHLLVEHRIGGLPIVDDARRVVGVVSEADFLVKEAGERDRPGPLGWLLWGAREEAVERHRIHAVTAGEAMTSPAVTIAADRPVRDAARMMTESGVNRLPVVEGDRLVGIVTRADLVRAFARTDEELLAVARHAVRAVDGMTVASVADGVVTLTGVVSHPAVAASATRVVAAIEGVVAVDDRDVSWQPEGVRPADGLSV